jgi:hypothetical protein
MQENVIKYTCFFTRFIYSHIADIHMIQRSLLIIAVIITHIIINNISATPLDGIYALRLINKKYSGPVFTVCRSSDNQKIDIGSINGYLDTSRLNSFAKNDSLLIIAIYDQNSRFPPLISRNPTKSYTVVRLDNGEFCLQTRKVEQRHLGYLGSEKKINIGKNSITIASSLLDKAYTPYYAKIVGFTFTHKEIINIGISNYSTNICVEHNNHRYISSVNLNDTNEVRLSYSRKKDSIQLNVSNLISKEVIMFKTNRKTKSNAKVNLGDRDEGYNAVAHRVHYIKISSLKE